MPHRKHLFQCQNRPQVRLIFNNDCNGDRCAGIDACAQFRGQICSGKMLPNDCDRQGTLKTLLLLEAAGTIRWRRLGDDALWLPA